MSEAFRNCIFLALSGGFQDAYTYFTRDGVFANAQTGNVVLMSTNFMTGKWGEGLKYLFPILAFALGVFVADLMNYAFNGFSIETGVSIVDPMLNRGGVLSMSELLVTFMVASVMGAVITSSGILDVLAKNVLLKFIKNRTVLVFVTLVYCYVVNFLTAGGQTVSIIVTEQTFESTYEDMNISRKVLSRTLEDSGTLSAPIVPWGVATIYVMGVLGCSTAYIPYAWFIFIVPIFSMICAMTGIGVWDKDGNPVRK